MDAKKDVDALELVSGEHSPYTDTYLYRNDAERFPFVEIALRQRTFPGVLVESSGPFRIDQRIKKYEKRIWSPKHCRTETIVGPIPGDKREGVARSVATLLFEIHEITR